MGRGRVFLGDGVCLRNCRFYFEGVDSNSNRIYIGSDSKIKGVEFILRYGGSNKVVVGSHTTFGGEVQIEASEGTSINMGEDCMFAHRIWVTTTDHHSLLSSDGNRINGAKSIYIGSHVWVGTGCTILKGSQIPNGSIIGANSTYTADHLNEMNSIYAGIPAKKIKSNVIWNRNLV